MKTHKIVKLFALLAIVFLAVSCEGGTSPSGEKAHTGDSSDPIPVAEGAWADCSLTASVVTGYATDQAYYSTHISTPGDYVVEYRNMKSGIQASDFLWTIDSTNNWSLRTGQEASGFVAIASAGDYDFLIRNDNATTAMTCQVRLVLLSASNFYIPSEGKATAPVALTLGTPHAGKVGLWSSDDPFNESFYSFTTTTAGTYTIDAALTDAVSMAALWVDLYTDSSFTGTTVTFGGLPKTPTLAATTTYYLSITAAVGAGTRPTYQLTVSAP